jgi:hypothetical protein
MKVTETIVSYESIGDFDGMTLFDLITKFQAWWGEAPAEFRNTVE